MPNETIERALRRATDTKACVIGEDVLVRVVPLFREWFPEAGRALVVCDPRTRAAAGERVEALLRADGIEVLEHVLEPGGAAFHADYRYAAEVRD
ncbi:MAG: sn-glycerol-1-phosphate dehydrogenase, partial [Kiritimatiellae bacterium]|nr:sn-glycerol-1-phosphate dehydrogenase [Kiritimatiellia bacterium]